ncbi:hypothetical protein D3C77_677680 [compost metagenome]
MSNAQELYDEIKQALNYFGIRFHDMHLMTVEFHAEGVTFIYGNRKLEVLA